MSIDEFRANPWKRSHAAYDTSPFNIRPAPEFATAEVIVASLYRSSGYRGVSESMVPKLGREFDKAARPSRNKKEGDTTIIQTDTWRTILHGVLESPKQPKQSSKRFLQLSPVVPEVTLYSGSARLVGNSWNPGALIQRMVLLGSTSIDSAKALWSKLFNSLSVTEADDIWARWLQAEFRRREKSLYPWEEIPLVNEGDLSDDDKRELNHPAQQFCKDLDAVIEAKNSITRRQWISVLEAITRLGSVMHVLWLCRVNERLWRTIHAILAGETSSPSTVQKVRSNIVSAEAEYLAYGKLTLSQLRNYASGYLVARSGINLVMWLLEAQGNTIPRVGSSSDMMSLLELVARHREKLLSDGILDIQASILDEEARTVGCKKGIGSNLFEFARHSLGQRQTASETLRGYDQSYFIRKRGTAKTAPWILSMGPVAVLAMVHCCLREAAGPRSVKRLCDHLANYGLEVDLDDIANGDLGHKLRMLGLVLDSPDAESGMLLVPPFSSSK
jgi:hypothetical protein